METEYYENHIRVLFGKAFGIELGVIKRYYSNKTRYVLGIRVCGKRTKEFFSDFLGFPVGEKSCIVRIPKVVLENKGSWTSYIRGVFDTDGSLYLHTCGKRSAYRSPIIDIYSQSEEHIAQLKDMAKLLGFNFWTESNGHKIRMAGWGNTERFFKVIKPHNNMKLKRFREIYAEVAER